MSSRWPAGVIRKTPVTPAGPLQNGAAPGVWTLAEATYWQKQGLWPIAGNFLAVEDVFSTWLYTGNGSTQTITNGIDLSGKGGLVWVKCRSNARANSLYDTSRGTGQWLSSNDTQGSTNYGGVSAFNSNGFALSSFAEVNTNSNTFASWTFREASKFFDVVTYTGDGTNNRSIAHNLGAEPGMILVKNATNAQSWIVYHRSNGTGKYLILNNTGSVSTDANAFPTVSSTAFVPTANQSAFSLNANGDTYVAYLFAHDTSATGLIQCGVYSGDTSGSGAVNLGWEPQWLLVKNVNTGSTNWGIIDDMRSFTASGADRILYPNSTAVEQDFTASSLLAPTATGFSLGTTSNTSFNASGQTYVYMAIRRGPMKTPTVGTSVFAPVYGSAGAPGYKPGFVTDASFARGVSLSDPYTSARLISGTYLRTATADAAFSDAGYRFDYMNGWFSSGLGSSVISWNFRRAPGFFDVVCYTGTGANRTVNHNLGVAPELMIIKDRSSGNDGLVYGAYLPNAATNRLVLDGVQGALVNTDTLWNATNPTSTVFSLGTSAAVNANGQTYITYLFASCPGVSKVGTYTGNGSSQTINCGFTTGARFFLVKRTDSTDSTGNWWVWDSTRGITAPADPALTLNKSDAEVTSADATDPDNSGIIVNQEATCNINVNGATYIFLAIA